MTEREKRGLDDHITGHHGEDQFRGEPDGRPEADFGRPYPPKTYYCAVCHQNPVDALDGYDTCQECVGHQ